MGVIGRVVRRGVGRPSAVHRRRPAGGRRDASRPPQVFLPTYGLFDERRFFGAGDRLGAVDSQLGVRLGLCICEDFWHLPSAYLLALDGAQMLINISSSPGRDLAADERRSGSGRATSWRGLMRTYAQLTTSFVVFVQPGRRRGIDLVLGRLARSSPRRGDVDLQRRRSTTRACSSSTSTPADIRRERMALPLLRDERPELRAARTRADRPGARAGRSAEDVDLGS